MNFLNNFAASMKDIAIRYSILLKHLDRHAPYAVKRVKTKHLPDCNNDELYLSVK